MPRIKERKAGALLSIVGGKGNILDVDTKVVPVALKDALVSKQD